MAVAPAVSATRHDTLARITSLRTALQAVINEVSAGQLPLADVFRIAAVADPDEAIRLVYLVKLLEVLPMVGKVRARRMLAAHGLGDRTRVGEVPVDVAQSLCGALS